MNTKAPPVTPEQFIEYVEARGHTAQRLTTSLHHSDDTRTLLTEEVNVWLKDSTTNVRIEATAQLSPNATVTFYRSEKAGDYRRGEFDASLHTSPASILASIMGVEAVKIAAQKGANR